MLRSIAEVFKGGGNEYAKLLDDPRWRLFTRKIRREDGNACQCCKRSDKVTQVHHLFYDGRKPWEYERRELALLCEGCHKELHVQLQNFRKFVFGKLTPRAMQVINGSLLVGLEFCEPIEIAHAIEKAVKVCAEAKARAKETTYNATERGYDERKNARIEGTYLQP
jgi:hypothetical protein